MKNEAQSPAVASPALEEITISTLPATDNGADLLRLIRKTHQCHLSLWVKSTRVATLPKNSYTHMVNAFEKLSLAKKGHFLQYSFHSTTSTVTRIFYSMSRKCPEEQFGVEAGTTLRAQMQAGA